MLNALPVVSPTTPSTREIHGERNTITLVTLHASHAINNDAGVLTVNTTAAALRSRPSIRGKRRQTQNERLHSTLPATTPHAIL